MILQAALLSPLAQQPTTSNSQWWWLLIIGLILLVAFFYWWRQVSEEDLDTIVAFEQKHPQALAMPAGFAPPVIEETPAHDDHAHDTHAHDTHAHAEETAEETAVTPDDLKRIEGIGPKIAELLNGAGIFTFAQLAAADPADLENILAEGGPRFQLADATSWPKQAALAASADWAALEALQDTLKAGRHVEDAE